MREFPVPINLKHLRQFLGLTSHYRHFIQRYVKLAHPLYVLTRKGAWTSEYEVAFETLKSKLLTPPILIYFCLGNRCQRAWSWCYFFQQDNKLHSVAYASRPLSNTEASYTITTLYSCSMGH